MTTTTTKNTKIMQNPKHVSTQQYWMLTIDIAMKQGKASAFKSPTVMLFQGLAHLLFS
jgi:hypothetical protein